MYVCVYVYCIPQNTLYTLHFTLYKVYTLHSTKVNMFILYVYIQCYIQFYNNCRNAFQYIFTVYTCTSCKSIQIVKHDHDLL